MAAQIGKAGSDINLRLGQQPRATDQKINAELQPIYNSLHILNGYLSQIRNIAEGTDDGTPAENLPFRRKFIGTAGQNINAGDIVSVFGTVIVKGMARYGGNSLEIGYPGTGNYFSGPYRRDMFGCYKAYAYVALTTAAAGAQVEVGVGGGALYLPGVKCGQMVWAADARNIVTIEGLTNGTYAGTIITDQPLSGIGSIYLSNPVWGESFGAASTTHEGIVTPGYPFISGNYRFKSRAFLYPVAIALADNYVYFYDYIQES